MTEILMQNPITKMRKYKPITIITAFAVMTANLQIQAGIHDDTYDEKRCDATKVCTHPIAKGYPYIEKDGPAFSVSVNDETTALYNDTNYWGGNVTFGSFEFADGHEIAINIRPTKTVKFFEILPHNAAFTSRPRLKDGTIEFKIKAADQKLTLVINGDYRGDVLHLFCNSIDKDVPEAVRHIRDNAVKDTRPRFVCDSTARTVYFGSGFHRIKDKPGMASSTLTIGHDWTVYIDGGAVVEGQMNISKANGARICGRGMLMNAEPYVTATITDSQDSRIEGITIHGHRAQCWNTIVGTSQRCGYRNVNLVTTRYASTDGLDINHCQDCTWDNVFIRSADDAVAIKGLADAKLKPTDCPPNKNLTFTRMQLWNDCNNAFGMGAETRASAYQNIRLADSEILFSYDDPNYHEKLDERAAMNICALQGTWFRDIVFENILVNRCERLASMGFKGDFWFGAIQGDQTFPGGIDGVTFRNVSSPHTSGSSIANDILLYGWHKDGTPDKHVEHITFDNVQIAGRRLVYPGSQYIKRGPIQSRNLVRNLIFK